MCTATRRPWCAEGTASSTSRLTVRPRTRQRGHGEERRSCVRDGLKIRSARSDKPNRRRSRRAGSAAHPSRAIPGLACTQYPPPIRIVYTDQDLRTTYTHHVSASLQRQVTPNWVVEGSYIGKIGRELVGHNFFNAAPYINSPVTGQAPSLQNVEERVPFSPGIISAASRVLGNFFSSEYHSPAAESRTPHGSKLLALGVLCAIQESDESAGKHDRTDQQHSQSVRPRLDVGAFYPRPPACDRRLVGVESQRYFSNAVSNALLNGWTMTGFHRIQSGSPVVFTTGVDVAQNGVLNSGGQYAALVSGATADDLRRDFSSTDDMVAQYFNTAAFVPLNSMPRGQYGNAMRGLVYGPGDSTYGSRHPAVRERRAEHAPATAR